MGRLMLDQDVVKIVEFTYQDSEIVKFGQLSVDNDLNAEINLEFRSENEYVSIDLKSIVEDSIKKQCRYKDEVDGYVENLEKLCDFAKNHRDDLLERDGKYSAPQLMPD